MLTRHQGLAYLILTAVVEVSTDVSSCLLLECRFPSSSRGRKKTSEMQTWLGLRWVLHTEQHSERMAFAVLCHWVKKTWKAELQHKRTTWEQMLMKGEGRFYFPGSFILSSQRHLLWGRKDASAVQKRKKKLTKFSLLVWFYIYVKVRQRVREFQSPTPLRLLTHFSATTILHKGVYYYDCWNY